MKKTFLLYGATGFVGQVMARKAVEQGLHPVLGGRNREKLQRLAKELNLDYLTFSLEEIHHLDEDFKHIVAVLNCAGPFMQTYKPMLEFCIAHKLHYLDIGGEIPVFEAIAAYDEVARQNKIMFLPGVGFDVLPTDCLALYLKEKFPEGTHLVLGFHSDGPAGLPPGTLKTMVELIPYGNLIRKNGKMIAPEKGIEMKMIDFGQGVEKTIRLTWGDVYTAYQSTKIPNIEVYAVFPKAIVLQLKMIESLRPIFSLRFVRNLLKRTLKGGSTEAERKQTSMAVWGELSDDKGNEVQARLYGPDGGVGWTSLGSLSVMQKVLSGNVQPGYQTPAKAYGSDLVLEVQGIVRTDLPFDS